MCIFRGSILIILIIFNRIYLTYAISAFIKTYEKLSYDRSHLRVRRSIVDKPNDNEIVLNFLAFQRNFQLHLKPDHSIFHSGTEIISGNNTQYGISDFIPVKGVVQHLPFSRVFGTIVNGVFRGNIRIDYRNDSEGSYYIENSAYYFPTDPGFHSLIYHDSHMINEINNSTNSSSSMLHHCGWSKPNVAHQMHLLSVQHNNPKDLRFINSRLKRAAKKKNNQLVCSLYLQSDTFLWNEALKVAKNSPVDAIKEIRSLFALHVQGANDVYQNTVFQTHSGTGNRYNGIWFRIDRVVINQTENCESPLKETNPFCSPNLDVTNFLNLNSYMQHDEFCLAYIFTFRDFSGGTLGLAWVAEPGGSGGICEKHRMMQEGTSNPKKSLNTGIVTLLNYGQKVPIKVSQLTFAHEMGHNFGSKHDDDHKEYPECLPSVDDPKGNYIMFASATSGDKENNNKFSKCSKDSISRLLDRVTASNGNCFLHHEGSFCGNHLTEVDEQCDCGYSLADCQDKCCHPKKSSQPCKLRSYEGITVQCSPTAGECCTSECQFRPISQLCRTKGECYQAAYCNGNHTRCPPSKKIPDLTKCQENTRVCKNGECIGSICESVPGWQECSLERSEKVTPEMMCYVACKENKTHATCISTFHLEKDIELQRKYPLLANQLLPKNKAIQLKAGAPCDNYHGYCDVFLRCRSVEADGPLARIKNLIFNLDFMQTIRKWMTQYWWAVMLISIGSIIFVGLFLKICSRSTPSTDPNLNRSNQSNSSRRKNRRPKNHRPRNNGAVPNGVISPSAPSTRLERQAVPLQEQRNVPVRPPRLSDRPLSLCQTNSNNGQAAMRPVSMIIESSIPIRTNEPSYPPPPYNEVSHVFMPPQHGHGRGKKGHRQALNHQASRYK